VKRTVKERMVKIQETKTGRKYIKVKGKRLYLNTFLKRVNKKRLICHLLPISKITEKNAEKLILFLLDPTKKKLPKVKKKQPTVKQVETKIPKITREKVEKSFIQLQKLRNVAEDTKKQIKTEKDKDIVDKLKKSLKETQEAERAQAKLIKEVGQDLDKAIKDLNKDLPKEQKLPTYRETYPEVFKPAPTEAEIAQYVDRMEDRASEDSKVFGFSNIVPAAEVRESRQTGEGILKKIFDFTRQIITGRDKLGSKFEKRLNKFKDQKIKEVYIVRAPIIKGVEKALDLLNKGKLKKEMVKAGYDDLFHLTLNIVLENGVCLRIEKNETVYIDRGCIYKNPKPETGVKKVEVKKDITLGEAYDKMTKGYPSASRLYGYDSVNNNCQRFVNTFLSQNKDAFNYTGEDKSFVVQDVRDVMKKFKKTKGISKKITDLASRLSLFLTGGAGPDSLVGGGIAGDKEKLRKLWNNRNGYPNLSDSVIWQQNDYPYLENFDKGIKEIRTSNFINNLNTTNREHKETINSLDEKIKSGKRYVSILGQYIDEKPYRIKQYKERINKLTNEIKRNTRIKSLFETSDNDKKEMDELLNIPSKGSKNVKSIIKNYITNDTFKSLYDELKEIDDLEKKEIKKEIDDLADDENQEGGFRPIDFYQRQINMATRQIQNLQPLRHGNAIKALKKFLKGRYQDHGIEPSETELLLSEMTENWPRNRTINIEIPTNINSSRRLDFSNDKDEKEQKGGLIDQPEEALSNVEIENIMKKYKNFLGVSPVDTGYKLLHMVKPKSNGGLIYNLDKAGERGSHWVAVYYDARPGRKNNICYYDSFGRDIPKEIQGDIKQIVKLLDCDKHMKLKINRKVNQDKSSVSCGYLCCLFLMDLFRNKSFKSATGFSVKKNEDRAEDLQEKFDYIL